MNDRMNKFEWLAIILIIAAVVARISSPLTQIIIMKLFSNQEYQNLCVEARLMGTIWNMIIWLVNIVIAVWLFVAAKRNVRAKWIWALFGLTYGLSAIILYFIMDLIEEIKGLRKQACKPTGDCEDVTT